MVNELVAEVVTDIGSVNALVTACCPASASCDVAGVVAATDVKRTGTTGLILEVALQAERVVTFGQHFLVG